ncbi:MAG: hypothetical protein RLZZ179_2308 [Verrucomicrobiota bacterium]|jgi:hypothetical protein
MMTDTELDGLLRQSKLHVEMPPTFQAEVWRRIAMAEEASLWRRVAHWLEMPLGWVAKPLGAVALCALTVAGGLLLGGREKSRRPDGRVAYLESVSPFVVMHRSEK